MLNRPFSTCDDVGSSEEPGWNTDRDPRLRLAMLWVFILIPILVVAGRVAQLQLNLHDQFTVVFSQTNETLEPIPARDGRILAADGSVLAGDVERYDLAVYYPAIQRPADDGWVNDKAKRRLGKIDRKKPESVAAEKQKVLEELDQFWQRLADITQRPLDELSAAREREQQRVERIKEAVRRKHRKRSLEAVQHEAGDEIPGSQWQALGQQFQRLFAEPPETDPGPRQIKEELDYHVVISDIDADTKSEIEAHPERYPYTRILVHSRRTYPRGELASHLIGFRRPITEEQLKARQQRYPDGDPEDYRLGDPCGVSGLELSYDSLLKGVRGQRAIVRNRRGEIVETRIVSEPRHGRDLVVTIDADVQQRAEQLLDDALNQVTMKGSVDPETHAGTSSSPTCPQGGCIVAMDVHSGAILAAASAPRFDLNLLVAPDQKAWADVMADPRGPFVSRVTQMALPPGSVFKIVSAVASIESGKMPPDAHFHCQGFLDRPDRNRCLQFRHHGVGHGDVTIADALCRSCNVYFYTAARRMGPQSLVDWARKFGIGRMTGIDLPTESAGRLPVPDAPGTTGEHREKWKPGTTLDLSIGQSTLEVTPLQMVRAMAAIANDGQLVTPHLAADSGPVSMSESSQWSSLRSFESQPIQGLHAETLQYVREGLTMVVHHPRGTGYKTVRLKEITIAGKTGTAETSGVDHAWFAGYVPAERPRIAFVVVLQNGGGGGSIAGPVAQAFVKTLVEMGLVTRPAPLVTDRSSKRSTSHQSLE